MLVEYAKASPDDLLVRLTVSNRGPEAADPPRPADALVPQHLDLGVGLRGGPSGRSRDIARLDGGVLAEHETLGRFRLAAETPAEWVFTENETNPAVFGTWSCSRRRGRRAVGVVHFKDAFHHYVRRRDDGTPSGRDGGTKAAAVYRLEVPAGGGGHRSGSG